MKLNKLVIGAALVAAGALVSAQTVSFHGYMDYTNFAVGQEFGQKGTGDWDHSEASAEFGSFYNGRTETNLIVSAGSFNFAAGIRLDAGGNDWYSLYKNPAQDYADTLFHQLNMKISFLDDQINVYTGRFEEWNAGYIFNGYELGGQNIRNLADRDNGQYFTGIEYIPNISAFGGALAGLKVIAGVPILPVAGNGVNADSKNTPTNQWKNLYKAVKVAASYKVVEINTTFNAGYRPCTFYTGVSGKDYTESKFGEAYIQADMPTTIPGVKMNASYDFRYRNVKQTGTLATAHYFSVGGHTDAIPGIGMNFENRFYYADDHYIKTNEKVLYDQLGISVVHAFDGKPYSVGCAVRGAYGVDANGTAFDGGDGCARISGEYSDDFSFSVDWMKTASPVAGGANNYASAYAFPYFQKTFQNGYFKTGVEAQYSRFWCGKSADQNITYRVPVMFCFWF